VTLLNPAGLLFLATIPLIIMLHLFRQERRRQEVSSLFLWREISDQHSRRMRPRLLRNVNLLLQVIAAAVIALAIARPVAGVAVGQNAPRMIMLVDTSASMAAVEGQVTRLDLAKNRAREIAGRTRRGTEIMVATAGPLPAVSQGFTTDYSTVYEAIRGLEVQDGPGEIRAAAAMIRSLGDTSGTEVVFVTDGAFDSDESLTLPANFRVERVGTALPNLAITAFELRQRFDASALEAYLELANFGPAESQVFLELTADGASLSSREYSIGSGSIERIPVTLPGTGATVYEARLIDTGDALRTDDSAFAVAGSSRPLRVQLVTPGNYFLESILAVYPNVRLSVTDTLQRDGSTDVYVIDSVDVPSGLSGSILTVNTVMPGGPFQASGHTEINQPVSVNPAHPVSRNLDLSDVSLTRVISGNLADRALTVATAGQVPVIYTFVRADVRLAAFLFSMAETDLGLRSSFPVLMNNVITWLAPSPRETGISSVEAGTVVPLLVTPGAPFGISDPAGDVHSLITRENTFNYRDTMKAGVYRVAGLTFSDAFAVSLTDAGESDLRPRFAVADQSTKIETAGVADTGRPLARWLLVLAVLLFVADWIIWARRT